MPENEALADMLMENRDFLFTQLSIWTSKAMSKEIAVTKSSELSPWLPLCLLQRALTASWPDAQMNTGGREGWDSEPQADIGAAWGHCPARGLREGVAANV